jgi:hypothetical protein
MVSLPAARSQAGRGCRRGVIWSEPVPRRLDEHVRQAPTPGSQAVLHARRARRLARSASLTGAFLEHGGQRDHSASQSSGSACSAGECESLLGCHDSIAVGIPAKDPAS